MTRTRWSARERFDHAHSACTVWRDCSPSHSPFAECRPQIRPVVFAVVADLHRVKKRVARLDEIGVRGTQVHAIGNEPKHDLVDRNLIASVPTSQSRSNLLVDVGYRPSHSLTEKTLAAVAQFDRFMFSRRGAAGNRRAAACAGRTSAAETPPRPHR